MMLLIGGDSEIGAATAGSLKAHGVAVWATTRRRDRVCADRPFLDLAVELDHWEPPPGARSACILAAVARLGACATDPDGSSLINVTRTLTLIERLIARDIHVLFLSTNQVFDGSAPNVAPDAPTCPTSEYGRQKARVEAQLRLRMEEGAPVAVLRLGKVVSPVMPLVESWFEMLMAGKPISSFHDMPVAPTPVDLVSQAMGALMRERARGIYQLTGPRDVTYAEIGCFLAARLGVDPKLVTEVSARDAGLPEGATPRFTTLDSTRLRQSFGLKVPDVWMMMERMIATIGAGRIRLGPNAAPR